MYVIYHGPMKRSFRYDQKTKTFQQIDIKECELTTRYLLCQDAIFHRIIDTTGSDIQRVPLSYVDEQMTMKKLQRKDKLVSSRQNNNMGQKAILRYKNWPGTNLNEYELIQDEYLKNLGTNENCAML